jgi:hypothetical protein
MPSEPGHIVIVDDEPDERARTLRNDLRASGQCTADVSLPEELRIDDLRAADLVLVDFKLWEWPERDGVGEHISRKPADGAALLAVLRQHLRGMEEHSPTAFALYTGVPGELASPLPPENRYHILARLTNAEWVFSKSEQALALRVACLANAVKALPEAWKQSDESQLFTLLGLQNLLSAMPGVVHRLQQDVLDCLPPIHELASWSHGLAIIRWLLQRIFVYPCFLWRPIHLAARLHIAPDPEQIKKAIEPGSKLRAAFSAVEYGGILANFDGPMWWRKGVEAILWDKTEGKPFEDRAVHGYVGSLVDDATIIKDRVRFPVVVVNENFEPYDVVSSEVAVRVRPDDWPAYADQAWMTIDQAKSKDNLRSVVVEDDRERLSG